MIFDRERGPYPVAYDLTQCGRLRRLTALEKTGNTFSVGFETLDRELFDPEPCYSELARLGARFARIQSGWARCEKSPGVYDFDWLDRVVASFLAVGMEPWMSLTFGNPLYSPGAPPSAVGCPPVNYGPRAVSGWERFVAEIVRRYRGKIRYYEIWNEPDNRQFWGPGAPNPAEYIELARITSAVIRREDPATKIIGGATAMGRLFSRECFQLGLGKYCDIYSFHAYGMYPEFGFGNNVAMLRSLIDRYAPGMELWLGESGRPSQSREQYDEWLKLYDCSEEIQAKWLARCGAQGKKLFSGPRLDLTAYLPERRVTETWQEAEVPLTALLPASAPAAGCNQLAFRAFRVPPGAGLELRNIRVELPPVQD